MNRQFMGMCPKQNKVTIVSIDYIDVSDTIITCYSKGILYCEYNAINHCCSASDCPIWQSAPKEIGS